MSRLTLFLLAAWAHIISLGGAAHATARLAVSQDGTGFEYAGKRVFLSGANQPWLNYGSDFGNNQTNGVACALQEAVANVSAAGGNTVRMWLFVEGDSIPQLDAASGQAVAPDAAGSLVSDMRKYARYAASRDVFIVFCLWNGAVLRNNVTIGLITEEAGGDKLRSLTTNVIGPMVSALKGEPNIVWELMNEPCGSLKLTADAAQPCYDTQAVLQNTGAGWAGHTYTMQQLLRFLAAQAAAIHAADSAALQGGGGGSGGNAKLDFFQVHAYPKGAPGSAALNGSAPFSPFARHAADYQLGKPVVIGEFGASKAGCPSSRMFEWAYEKGYAGVWEWAVLGGDPTRAAIFDGIASIKARAGVSVHIGGAAPADTCHCSDQAPPGQYTCAQQAGWGKCDTAANPWMKGFCCKSCLACQGCS
eukprot:g4792.t1